MSDESEVERLRQDLSDARAQLEAMAGDCERLRVELAHARIWAEHQGKQLTEARALRDAALAASQAEVERLRGELAKRDEHDGARDIIVQQATQALAREAAATRKAEELERERDEARAVVGSLETTVTELTASNLHLVAALRWALGESADGFPERPSDEKGEFTKGPYWWRAELRARAALSPAPGEGGE